jgi:putative transposase
MIKQHLQTAILPPAPFVTATVLPSENAHSNAIPSVSFANAELQEFIALRPNAREVRKALAVKLVYQGYLYEEIQKILDVSLGSITGWKQAYEEYGIDGLRLTVASVCKSWLLFWLLYRH